MSRTFDGTTAGYYLTAAWPWPSGFDPFTISAWIFPTAWGAASGNGPGWIWHTNTGAGFDSGVYVSKSATGGGGTLTGTFGASKVNTPSVAVSVDSVLVLNKWQYVTFSLDNNSVPTLYVNGIEVSYSSQVTASPTNPTGGVMVGNEATSGTANGFTGLIDTFAIWGASGTGGTNPLGILTTAQIISALAYHGVPTVNPTHCQILSYWPVLGVASPEPDSIFDQAPRDVSLTVSNAILGANSPGQQSSTISGSVGMAGAGATVRLAGSASASTTADGSGNYSFTGLIAGTYQVTPGLTGSMFSPSQQIVVITTADVTGINFTLFTPAASGAGSGRIASTGASFATRIESPNTEIMGTNLRTRILE